MRPTKARIIGHIPSCCRFRPVPEGGDDREGNAVIIGLDMLEAMRLVDMEGLSQEDAAQSMDISTPTLCRILGQGRKLAAMALTSGKAINLEGGNIMFGNGNQRRNGCCNGSGRRNFQGAMPASDENVSRSKGMRHGHGKGKGHGCMARKGQENCARHGEERAEECNAATDRVEEQ